MMDSNDDRVSDAKTAIRIVLADDHPIVLEGLKLLIEAQPGMTVVGAATDGLAAWRMAQELRPDVLLIDLGLPVLSGTEVVLRVRRDCPDVKILAVTIHEERSYVAELMQLGALGYVLKRSASQEIVKAISTIAAGGTYLDPQVSHPFVKAQLDDTLDGGTKSNAMSTRERQVLIRLARGFSNKEIAAELGISVKSVETYKMRVKQKLGFQRRADIVRYGIAEGWFSTEGK